MTTRVEITTEQLPDSLRPLLIAWQDAMQEAKDAQNDFNLAPIPNRYKLKEGLDQAHAKARDAHTALLEGTRERPGEMREYAHARFAAAVERAREHLQAAEAELRAAAGYAAVHGSIREGRPCVNTERGAESAGRKRALFAVGLVRDAADSLPDAID